MGFKLISVSQTEVFIALVIGIAVFKGAASRFGKANGALDVKAAGVGLVLRQDYIQNKIMLSH